jgi:hypothetical protein
MKRCTHVDTAGRVCGEPAHKEYTITRVGGFKKIIYRCLYHTQRSAAIPGTVIGERTLDLQEIMSDD